MKASKDKLPPPPLFVLRGHTSAVNSLEFYNHDNYLWSGSVSGEIIVFNTKLRRSIINIDAHSGSVLSINTISRYVIGSSGRDGYIKVWDAGQMLATANNSTDENISYSNSYDNFLITKLKTGCCHFCNSSTSPAIMPDVIISPSEMQSQVLVWDIRTPRHPSTILSTDQPAPSLVTTTSNTNSSSSDSDKHTGDSVSAKHGMVTALRLSAPPPNEHDNNSNTISNTCNNNDLLLSALGGDSSGAVDDPEQRFLLNNPIIDNNKEINNHCSNDNSNNKNAVVYAGLEDGAVMAFDLRMPDRPLWCSRSHAEPVLSISTSVNGNNLAIGSAGKYIYRYQLISRNQRIVIGKEATKQDSNAAQSEDSRRPKVISLLTQALANSYTAVSNNSDSSSVFRGQVATKEEVAAVRIDSVSLPRPGTSGLDWRHDGRILVSAHWDQTVRIYDQKRMKPLAILKHHRDGVQAVAFPHYLSENTSRNSNNIGSEYGLFATGSKDSTIAIWNTLADTMK